MAFRIWTRNYQIVIFQSFLILLFCLPWITEVFGLESSSNGSPNSSSNKRARKSERPNDVLANPAEIKSNNGGDSNKSPVVQPQNKPALPGGEAPNRLKEKKLGNPRLDNRRGRREMVRSNSPPSSNSLLSPKNVNEASQPKSHSPPNSRESPGGNRTASEMPLSSKNNPASADTQANGVPGKTSKQPHPMSHPHNPNDRLKAAHLMDTKHGRSFLSNTPAENRAEKLRKSPRLNVENKERPGNKVQSNNTNSIKYIAENKTKSAKNRTAKGTRGHIGNKRRLFNSPGSKPKASSVAADGRDTVRSRNYTKKTKAIEKSIRRLKNDVGARVLLEYDMAMKRKRVRRKRQRPKKTPVVAPASPQPYDGRQLPEVADHIQPLNSFSDSPPSEPQNVPSVPNPVIPPTFGGPPVNDVPAAASAPPPPPPGPAPAPIPGLAAPVNSASPGSDTIGPLGASAGLPANDGSITASAPSSPGPDQASPQGIVGPGNTVSPERGAVGSPASSGSSGAMPSTNTGSAAPPSSSSIQGQPEPPGAAASNGITNVPEAPTKSLLDSPNNPRFFDLLQQFFVSALAATQFRNRVKK